MNISDIFPSSVLAEVLDAITKLNRLWDSLNVAAPLASLVGMGAWTDIWTGYAISVVDPANPRLRFFFKTAVDINEFSTTMLAPLGLGGLPFDFQQNLRFRAIGPPTLQPGAQLSVTVGGRNEVGTLGAFLVEPSGAKWIMSANHVLAFNGIFEHAPTITQGPTIVAGRPQFVKLDSFLPNPVDIAIAPLIGGLSVNTAIPGLPLAGVFSAASLPAASAISKVGAGSNTTQGKIDHFSPRLLMALPSCGIPMATMANQWLVADTALRPFSEPGDSGSIAVSGNEGSRLAFGILIGNNELDEGTQINYTIVTPMDAALEAINSQSHLALSLLI